MTVGKTDEYQTGISQKGRKYQGRNQTKKNL